MQTVFTLGTTLAALLLATSAQALTILPNYTLSYDPADGSLTINSFGGPLYTYSVKTTGELAVDDGFLEGNHLLLPDAPGGLTSPANTTSDDELSQSDFDGWTGLSPFSLGPVLPAGLNESEFNALIDLSTQNTFYVDELGTLGNPKTFKPFDIVFVPEPTSFVLLGIGGALLLQRRRRA